MTFKDNIFDLEHKTQLLIFNLLNKNQNMKIFYCFKKMYFYFERKNR